MNYYNEFDPYAAQWLRNLVAAGHIPNGEVDSRSITDVKASDLTGFVQCHFFAGLGGWSRALSLAGWPADRPVWTGSCPCQPFSAAGAGNGVTDERHLWPIWFELIRQCRPDVVFGEQVEAAINHGWLDLVQADLEGEGYACGAVGLPAGGVGAPHIRQRLWFVGHANDQGPQGYRQSGKQSDTEGRVDTERHGATSGVWGVQLADAVVGGRASKLNARGGNASISRGEADGQSDCGVDQLADAKRGGRPSGDAQPSDKLGNLLRVSQLADAQTDGRQSQSSVIGSNGALAQPSQCGVGIGGKSGVSQLADAGEEQRGRGATNQLFANGAAAGRQQGDGIAQPDSEVSFWSNCDWLPCRDGKARPVEPGTFPLAHGIPGRVGRLRAYGNAIVPQVAQTFIEAYLES